MLYGCHHCQGLIDTLQTDLSSGVCPLCGQKFKGMFAGVAVRDFHVIGELARGANGVVYLAAQPLLRRDVALKLIRNELSSQTETVQRFFSESRAAAKVNHPNIVQALSSGVDAAGICYFAMELIEGKSVEDRLEQFGALDFAEALHIGVRLTEAMAYAWWRVKLVHGDIKPANILIGKDGEPKLADLGLAHFGGKTPAEDSLMATPLYVAPELVRGEYEKFGFKTDMYSFGATLYEIFAGEAPLFSTDMDEVLQMQLRERPEPLRERLGFFDGELSLLVDRMLEKNPDLRPDSWSEVAEVLRKIELRTRKGSLR